jgi:hypothetical protein
VCDDARENKSTALGIQFFPVESVTEPMPGNSTALPDSFIAEGGAGGIPTTFIGCVGTANGNALARFDSMGTVIGANLQPRKLRGLESQGMIVAASLEGGSPVLAGFLEDVPVGARVK